MSFAVRARQYWGNNMGRENHKSLSGAAGEFLLAVIRRFIDGQDYLVSTNEMIAISEAPVKKRYYSIAELYGERIETDSMKLDCSPFVLVGLEAEYDRKFGKNNSYGHDKFKYVKERLPQLSDDDISYFHTHFRKTEQTEAARLGIAPEPVSKESPSQLHLP